MGTVITGPNPAFAAQFDRPQESPLSQIGQILALKQQQTLAPLQVQEAQQRVQSGQLDLQAKKRQEDSDAAIMQAYQESGGDLSKTVETVAKSGKVLPGAMAQLRQANYQMQEQAYKTLQEKGNRAIQEADFMDGAADAVKAAPPEQRPAVYQQQLQALAKQGIDVSQIPQEYPGDQAFTGISLGIKSHKNAIDQLAKQAETFKNTQQGNEAQAQTTKIQQETQFGPTGPVAEGKYRFLLSKAALGQTLTPEETAFVKGFEASNAKTTTASDSLGVTSTNTSRPAGLATAMRGAPASGGVPLLPRSNAQSSNPASPASVKSSLVDVIGQYKADPATLSRIMIKHPELLAQVSAKYPDWDQTTYGAKNKLIAGYTSGSQSKEINAINTAMGHVKVLDDAVEALNNGNVTALNKIGNNLGINVTGQTAPAVFKLIVHRVGPEISSAYIPGGGGEHERFANEKDFDENLPGQTLHANAAASVKLLRSKVGSLENQYKNTVGRDDFAQRFLTPEAQSAFQKFNNAPTPGGGGAPKIGDVKTFPNGRKGVWDGQGYVAQ